MSEIMVSICCLTYNHENYVKECLEGFLLQKTDFDIEILIHDDASTDRTSEIINAYEVKYPLLIKPIYQKENQFSRGIKPTFKYNIPRANGKYIALCEGDDYWTDPLKLQKQVDFLEKNKDYNISVGRFKKLFGESGEFIAPNDSVDPTEKNSFELKDYLKHKFSHTSTFLIRRDKIKTPSWFNEVFAADQALIMISAQNEKIMFHNDFFSVYRINSGGITKSMEKIKNIDKFIFLLENVNQHYYNKYSKIIYFRKLKLNIYKLLLKFNLNRLTVFYLRGLALFNQRIW